MGADSNRSYLREIVDSHRRAMASDDRDVEMLLEKAASAPIPRPFASMLGQPGLAVIAEIKRRSPSRGEINPDLVPGRLAGEYERGGAACLSVLTDEKFFGGSPADLQEARAAVQIPVLRKDFTVCRADVADARLIGADAILLIVAALSDGELPLLFHIAEGLGLAVLVEVHDENEIERALSLIPAQIIGVNQRDLNTFDVEQSAAALVDSLPPNVIKVAESGVSTPEEAGELAAMGYDAVLVGTSLLLSPDPEAAVRLLVQAAK